MKKIIYISIGLSLVACTMNDSSTDEKPPSKPGVCCTTDGGTPLPDGGVILPDGGVIYPDSGPPIPPHCGDVGATKCALGASCRTSADCESQACNYLGKCISNKSCINHFGGDTCGKGEVGTNGTAHESCCRSLVVPGYSDGAHPGKAVYLDKYEITAGRVRAFVEDITKQMNGKPDVKSWIVKNKPEYWNNNWNTFLPSEAETGTIIINRLLLGDPRHDGQSQAEAGPGIILPPPTDQPARIGMNYQFGAQVYADLHGNNCGMFKGVYGFATYYYPDEIYLKNNEVPRVAYAGIAPQEYLDVKSMNCITNAMLQAFCTWDGGQLASTEVLDYVTAAPSDRPLSVSGCGTQYDNHGDLLGNNLENTVQDGGRCPAVGLINASFDAGDNLPVPGSFLNKHVYSYPDFRENNSDKSWQIASPGRMPVDAIRVKAGDEPWMDLAGNLSEAVLETKNGAFTGRFGLRHRGIGYGSTRSDLNVTLMPGETILRLQRPEAKSALIGSRCMRFK